jgi:hypothetical protein
MRETRSTCAAPPSSADGGRREPCPVLECERPERVRGRHDARRPSTVYARAGNPRQRDGRPFVQASDQSSSRPAASDLPRLTRRMLRSLSRDPLLRSPEHAASIRGYIARRPGWTPVGDGARRLHATPEPKPRTGPTRPAVGRRLPRRRSWTACPRRPPWLVARRAHDSGGPSAVKPAGRIPTRGQLSDPIGVMSRIKGRLRCSSIEHAAREPLRW